MSFTELFCKSGGSNLNGGGLVTGLEPATTAAYTSTNGNFNGTDTFTPVDGSTPASSVAVGDFCSVFLDAATVAVYIARVTVVAAGVNGAITLSTTAKSGTAPTSNATGRTIKVGGAWLGPNAAQGFPFGFITAALTNAAGSPYRVNLKNSADYSITAQISQNVAGPGTYEGYTTTPGDGGLAAIDGGTSGAAYTLLLTTSGTQITFANLAFKNNGATGGAVGVNANATGGQFLRCVFHDIRSSGFFSNAAAMVVECEAYSCNQSNTAGSGGFQIQGSGSTALRCIAHGNTGGNNAGFAMGTGNCVLKDCVSYGNGAYGVFITGATVQHQLLNVDTYNNGAYGIVVGTGSAAITVYIENGSHVKNGIYGILGATTGAIMGRIVNCGFGSGTQANVTGQTSALGNIQVSGSITYPADLTPWVDPANGDFRINLAQAKGAGRGLFLQTTGGAGTVGYPDIGAASPIDVSPDNATIALIYAVVNSSTFGNAKLVRSTTPANTLDVSATGEAGLDFANIKDAAAPHTLTNIRVPNVTLTDTVTTYTGNTLQSGDSFARLGVAGAGLTALGDTRIANLDAAVSSRMATFSYTAPDNTGIGTIITTLGTPVGTVASDIAGVRAEQDVDEAAIIAAVNTGVTAVETFGGAGPWTQNTEPENPDLTQLFDAAQELQDMTSPDNVFTAAALANSPSGDCPTLAEIVAALTGQQITIISPVGLDAQSLTVNRGEAYLKIINNAVVFSVTHPSFSPAMTGDDTEVYLRLMQRLAVADAVNVTGEILSVSTNTAIISFDISSAITAALVPGDNAYRFDVEAVLDGDSAHVVTPIIDGVMNVRADI